MEVLFRIDGGGVRGRTLGAVFLAGSKLGSDSGWGTWGKRRFSVNFASFVTNFR